MARGGEIGRLLSWPRPYAANSYLTRLADALAGQGITTVSDRLLATLVAAPRGATWLHLHWPEWMVTDHNRVRARARSAWLAGLLDVAKLRGVRIAWTAHNLLAHDDPQPDVGRAARAKLLARCDAVFGHFPEAEADARTLGFGGVFALTPHPNYRREYPMAPTTRDAREQLRVATAARVWLAFGAIEPYKGLDRLVAEFRRCAPAREQLIVAGAPRSERAVDDLRRASAGDPRVRLEVRFIPDDEVPTFFAAADATVLPYREFYTSGVAMLSLTFGCPIVGPPRNHLASFASEAFFVPLADVANLGAALDVARGIDASARARAVEFAAECTWPRVARTIRATLFDGAPA